MCVASHTGARVQAEQDRLLWRAFLHSYRMRNLSRETPCPPLYLRLRTSRQTRVGPQTAVQHRQQREDERKLYETHHRHSQLTFDVVCARVAGLMLRSEPNSGQKSDVLVVIMEPEPGSTQAFAPWNQIAKSNANSLPALQTTMFASSSSVRHTLRILDRESVATSLKQLQSEFLAAAFEMTLQL